MDAVLREMKRCDLSTTTWVGSLYWKTKLSAFCYPGTTAMDPDFGQGAPQVYILSTASPCEKGDIMGMNERCVDS
jgi:hypothetical protein